MRKNSWDSPSQVDPWNTSTYQTGSTTPPKSHNGLIAALLVVVIALCGIITVLGITSAKLFQALGDQTSQEIPISFSDSHRVSSVQNTMYRETAKSFENTPLGLEGESVSKLYQIYYRLPQGLYINAVAESSSAARMGVHPGDIITSLNGQQITGPQDLLTCMEDILPGETVTLTIYRNSQHFLVEVMVEPWR